LITTLDYTIGITAASTAANTIADGDLNFSITGGSGVDTITAGGGADTITGGLSGDIINVGGGTDTVVFATTASSFAATALDTTEAGGVTTLTGIDEITGMTVGDLINVAGIANFTSGGTITSTAATELAAVTANGQAMVTGTWDAAAKTFTEGTRSSTVNDILFQIADGTNIFAVVLVDVVGTITGATVSGDIFTIA
jgi:Ca2+-binding RTX toxin-like protein